MQRSWTDGGRGDAVQGAVLGVAAADIARAKQRLPLLQVPQSPVSHKMRASCGRNNQREGPTLTGRRGALEIGWQAGLSGEAAANYRLLSRWCCRRCGNGGKEAESKRGHPQIQ